MRVYIMLSIPILALCYIVGVQYGIKEEYEVDMSKVVFCTCQYKQGEKNYYSPDGQVNGVR